MKYITFIIGCLMGIPFSYLYSQDSHYKYFVFDTNISLVDAEHIEIFGIDNSPVILNAGSQLMLIPPDMAKVDQKYIQQVRTDTISMASGLDKCISTCFLDTFFINEDLFLSDVRIEVPYFIDGTYEGASEIGWKVFNQLGDCKGPVMKSDSSFVIHIERMDPAFMTLRGRLKNLLAIDSDTDPQFPLQWGDIEEVRLIKCNTRGATQQQIEIMNDLLSKQSFFCEAPTVDPQVPPAKAVARIDKAVTVRFFEPIHEERAVAVAESISYLFGIPMEEIKVEDMLSAFGGTPPFQDYLEVWFQ